MIIGFFFFLNARAGCFREAGTASLRLTSSTSGCVFEAVACRISPAHLARPMGETSLDWKGPLQTGGMSQRGGCCSGFGCMLRKACSQPWHMLQMPSANRSWLHVAWWDFNKFSVWSLTRVGCCWTWRAAASTAVSRPGAADPSLSLSESQRLLQDIQTCLLHSACACWLLSCV